MTSDKQPAQAHSPNLGALDGTRPSTPWGKAPSSRDERSGHGDASQDSRGRDLTQTAVSICLIGLYIASLWVMFYYRNDRQWDRMVYLFSGYEAIVFVAVGAIFGTRIQRASVESATERARQAHEDLASERHRSHDATERAEAAGALATAVRSYAAWQAQEQEQGQNSAAANSREPRAGARGQGASPAQQAGTSPIGLDPGLAVLIDLADKVLAQRQWG